MEIISGEVFRDIEVVLYRYTWGSIHPVFPIGVTPSVQHLK